MFRYGRSGGALTRGVFGCMCGGAARRVVVSLVRTPLALVNTRTAHFTLVMATARAGPRTRDLTMTDGIIYATMR